MTENKNRQCHVFYRTAQSFGEMIIPQAPPITIKTLEHFRRIIRERNHISKKATVVIVCWQMLESEARNDPEVDDGRKEAGHED